MKKSAILLIFLLSAFSLSAIATIHAATQIDIYAGELSSSSYGFGTTASSISSNPSPTLTLTSGETYTVILHNISTQSQSHNFAIVDTKSATGNIQFNAIIGSTSNPVAPGSIGQVAFTAGSAGNYYYVCQVDGHVALGMWGKVVVNSAVPEFPAPLLIAFIAVAITALSAYFGKINTKITRRL
jgi:uncharacterized cupredoxin-like copper-binding protein